MVYLANQITKILLNKKIIEEDMTDVYRYGLEIIFSSLLTTLSILTIALLLDSLNLGILYFLLTIPLKLTAGGYHAETFKKCFFISNFSFAALICLHKILSYYNISELIWLSILYCSAIFIFLKAPVQNIHQPLTASKMEHNKMLSHIYLLTDCGIITCLTIALPTSHIIHFSVLCILLVALFIIPTQVKGGSYE